MMRESPFPMLPVEDALRIVMDYAAPRDAETRSVFDETICGQFTTRAIVNQEPFPPFVASTMDGYAVRAADGAGEFPVAQSVTAGEGSVRALGEGEVAYITTGAPLPLGADAVVKVEWTEAAPAGRGGSQRVRILRGVPPGQWTRPVGSDIAAGELVLCPRTRLEPADVGLLATLGISRVAVTRRPVVGVLSTGDEVADPGEEVAGAARIFDSNRPMLLQAARLCGATTRDLGIVRDSEGELEAALERAAQECDVIVTTGGVSMGRKDLLKDALARLGDVHFGRVRMKPGKPTTFATLPAGDGRPLALAFALPGNPVSAAVAFHLFARPAIRRLLGESANRAAGTVLRARLARATSLDPERPEYHRVALRTDAAGALWAHSTGAQISSRLLSMRGADGLACLPQARGHVPEGSEVDVLVLAGPSAGDRLASGVHASLLAADHPAVSTEAAPAGTLASGGCSGLLHGHDHGHAHGHAHGHSDIGSAPAAGQGGAVDGEEFHGRGGRDAGHDPSCKCQVPLPPLVARVGVLVVSTTAAAGGEDRGGPAILRALSRHSKDGFEYRIVRRDVVPDDADAIEGRIRAWVEEEASNGGLDLVLTTGGTGFTPMDVTPEAAERLIERKAAGLIHAIMVESLKIVPTACLSRAVAGIHGNRTLIITLPGSPKACEENIDILATALPHAIRQVRGDRSKPRRK